MSNFKLIMILPLLFALPAPSSAAELFYSAQIDLRNGYASEAGGWEVRFAGPDVSLSLGDTLHAEFFFQPGQAITIQASGQGPLLYEREVAAVLFRAFNGQARVTTISSFKFEGVSGDYDGPMYLSSNSSGPGIGSGTFSDITNTAFSFLGISFSATITGSNSSDPLVFQPELVRFAPSRPSAIPVPPAVPEPAVWATMLIGFGAIGGVMRARHRVSVIFA